MKQRQMTVEKYDQEFNMLSHFTSKLVDTEQARSERFVGGLKNEIEGFVRAFKPANLVEALRLAVDLSIQGDDIQPKRFDNETSSGQKKKAY